MPSDTKIWMGYEAHPNEYVKAEDGGYDRKPEYRAEQEEHLALPDVDDAAQQAEAEARKRATRRTRPMEPGEMPAALEKASQLARSLIAEAGRAAAQSHEAEKSSWLN